MAHECRPTWDDDQEFIEKTIRFWVHDARTKGGCLSEADAEDLAQNIRLDLLRRLCRFDPAKSSRRTFIALLIEHRVRSLSEEARVIKRGYGCPHVSLHDEINPDADAPTEIHETLSEDDYFRMTRGVSLSREASQDRAIDVTRAQARLTALEAEVCRLLLDKTKKEAAAELGIPRTTLQDMVRRIAKKLTQAGLKEYCD